MGCCGCRRKDDFNASLNLYNPDINPVIKNNNNGGFHKTESSNSSQFTLSHRNEIIENNSNEHDGEKQDVNFYDAIYGSGGFIFSS